jgi:hypothetical protein
MAVMHRILTEQPDTSGVPTSLLPVLRDCLNKDPRARPSARDLLLRLIDPSRQRDDAPIATGPVRDLPGATAPQDVPAQYVPPQYVPPRATGPTTWPRPEPRRSRRGPVLAAGGAAAAVAVIVAAVLLLTRGSPPSHNLNAGGTSSPAGTVSASAASQASTSASSSASPSVSAVVQPGGSRIPAAFAGTWSGTATMASTALPSLGLSNSISFTLANGGTTAAEVNGSCINTLTLTRATATVLTFTEPTTAQCEGGTVMFTLHGGKLAYLWIGGGEQNTATLRKK